MSSLFHHASIFLMPFWCLFSSWNIRNRPGPRSAGTPPRCSPGESMTASTPERCMTSGARSARANSFDQLQMVKLGETNVYICKSGIWLMIPSMGFNAWFVGFYFVYAVFFISSGAHSLVNSKPNTVCFLNLQACSKTDMVYLWLPFSHLM